MRGYSVRTFLIRLAAVDFCATPIAASAQLNLNLNKLFEAPETVQRASGEMDENLEIELGRGLMGRLIAAMPLVRDDAVQQYINDVGWWLVNHTERRSLPWRFAVTDTSTLGAFATPGGRIIVTRGLFALMQDEHELAGCWRTRWPTSYVNTISRRSRVRRSPNCWATSPSLRSAFSPPTQATPC